MKSRIYGIRIGSDRHYSFIGSHTVGAYKSCTFVGNGILMRKDGTLSFSNRSDESCRWNELLKAMSPSERLEMHIDELAVVDEQDQWVYEKAFIQKHKPRFNSACAQTGLDKKEKWNAYIRNYLPGYYERNPDKLEVKRKADRERIRARRAKKKTAEKQS